MTEEDNKPNRTVRHIVLKVLTDRPGSVIYRDDIAEITGIEGTKVADTISRLKRDNPEIGNDFEVVANGQAWRYIPNAKTRQALAVSAKVSRNARPDKPLTRALRDYFIDNPHRVIYVDELQSTMSMTDEPLELVKVRVGINNAKITDHAFRDQLRTVVAGQAWQYIPLKAEPAPAPAPAEKQAPAPRPTPPPSRPAVSAESSTQPASDDNLLLLEKLGNLDDGSLLVRDGEKNLFKLTKF